MELDKLDLVDRIGNTPLVRLPSPNPRVTIVGKMEGNNPGGSVKDRPVWSMVRRAEQRGELTPGTTLIEPTSGNTGIALAMVAAARGYRLELVMPANSTAERVSTMRAFGAHVILTSAEGGMEGTIDEARRRLATGGRVMLDQFSNADNWMAHYEGTGPEIWAQTAGKVTHFISAMGTTGTIMGVSRALRERSPDVCIVGCQPTPGSRIPGIRRWPAEYLPRIFEPNRVDRIMDIAQGDAEDAARELARRSGVFTGVSAAGAWWAACRIADEIESGLLVTILCDRGDRYLSSDLFSGAHPGMGSLEIIA